MKLEKNGITSLSSFLIGCSIIGFTILSSIKNVFEENSWITFIINQPWTFVLIHLTLSSIIVRIIFWQEDYWKVAVIGNFLGVVFGSAATILILLLYKDWWQFSLYICILSFFHFSEYLSTAVSNPSNLSLDSYLLNHSVSYWVAAVASWVEFILELYFLPQIKSIWYVSVLGATLCILGELVRKLAMLTADRNFNHVVQVRRHSGHKLITSGVYSFCRHPSYVGWFWWSVGTQILLINPICIILYTIASWLFFKHRIYFEEMTLINFFEEEYIQYQNKVGTGLPLIKGYVVEDH